MIDRMDLSNVHVAILAGGSGTRLWPLSRQRLPKQLLPLLGGRSLLQQTVDRVLPLVPLERIYILTGPDLAPAIHEQLPDLPAENLFIEPSPRGTAPCLGLAAMKLRERFPAQDVMISLHADHAVRDEERFRQALLAAISAARRGYLVTVGIVPTYPETGFGYIERGSELWRMGELTVFRALHFTEKPPLERAREFLATGRYYWNAGYFVWTLGNILDAYQRLLPELYARLDAMVATRDTPSYQRIWEQVSPVTVDVGIMEKAREVAVVPCEMGWSDVGSWEAIYDLTPHDAEGNALLGEGTPVAMDTRGTLIYAKGRVVATIGLEDMIVIETEDAILVLPRARAQEVGALVNALRARGLKDIL